MTVGVLCSRCRIRGAMTAVAPHFSPHFKNNPTQVLPTAGRICFTPSSVSGANQSSQTTPRRLKEAVASPKLLDQDWDPYGLGLLGSRALTLEAEEKGFLLSGPTPRIKIQLRIPKAPEEPRVAAGYNEKGPEKGHPEADVTHLRPCAVAPCATPASLRTGTTVPGALAQTKILPASLQSRQAPATAR